MPFDPQGGNVMIEVESVPATCKRRNIVFWPSVVMLVMVLGSWVFLYDDRFALLLWLAIHLFAVICLISFVCLIVLRRPGKSLSFLIPILLAASMGWWFIPVRAMTPITNAFAYSRDYVEFLIYDARHHIKAEVRNTRPERREWHLYKHSATDFYIVYDITDKTLKEDGTEQGGCYSVVFSLGEHFYFVRGICPGIL
jgi:hypothetical protein